MTDREKLLVTLLSQDVDEAKGVWPIASIEIMAILDAIRHEFSQARSDLRGAA